MKILFLHIPKTAGTTLLQIINKQYQNGEIADCYFKDPLQTEIFLKQVSHNPNVKMIYGHYNLGVRHYLATPYTFFTLLRDPVERVISFYYFLKTVGHVHQSKLINMSLEEFFLSKEIPYIPSLFYNSQTADLSADFPFLDKGGMIIHFPNTPYPPQQPPSLEKAKEHMEKYFSVVGITEMFDETLFMLKKAFSWRDISYTKQNVGINRPTQTQIPNHVIDLIMEKNQLDIQLYQWAKKRFEAKIQQLDEKDTQELKEFITKETGDKN